MCPRLYAQDYPLHQRRLFPFVAAAYVYSVAYGELRRMFIERTAKTTKAVHIMAAGVRPCTPRLGL